MAQHEIYWDDLTGEAQERLKDLYHENIDFSPLAIIDIEEDSEEGEIDLFNSFEDLPEEVQKVINSFSEDLDAYKECERLLELLKPLGYTIDYGLDGVPYNLKKIEPSK